MIIKNVSLDIVCGITSTLPDTELLRLHLRENQMWENLL